MKLKNMEKLRTDAKLTQQQLADTLHWSRDMYLNYENGKTQIPVDKLIQIAKYFNVSTDYILGLSECTSIENDYISKQTGLSDDAINGLKQIVDYDCENHSLIKNQNVINFMLSNYDLLKDILDWFTEYAIPFLYSIPVMTDSKGKWKKIDTKKIHFGLASSENHLDDNKYMPIDYMHVLIQAHAENKLRDALKDMANKFTVYLMMSGVTDAVSLLKYNYYSKTENSKL